MIFQCTCLLVQGGGEGPDPEGAAAQTTTTDAAVPDTSAVHTVAPADLRQPTSNSIEQQEGLGSAGSGREEPMETQTGLPEQSGANAGPTTDSMASGVGDTEARDGHGAGSGHGESTEAGALDEDNQD
jgi:hypothetical protein